MTPKQIRASASEINAVGCSATPLKIFVPRFKLITTLIAILSSLSDCHHSRQSIYLLFFIYCGTGTQIDLPQVLSHATEMLLKT